MAVPAKLNKKKTLAGSSTYTKLVFKLVSKNCGTAILTTSAADCRASFRRLNILSRETKLVFLRKTAIMMTVNLLIYYYGWL